MAKEKKVDLKAVAMKEMETLVEQVKTMLTEKTGYLKGLEDCDANCEIDA